MKRLSGPVSADSDQLERLIDVLARIHQELHFIRKEFSSELHDLSISRQGIT